LVGFHADISNECNNNNPFQEIKKEKGKQTR